MSDQRKAEKKVQNEAAENEKSGGKTSVKSEIISYVVMIAIVVGAVFVINTFFLINARIPSASMEDTIMTHDRVFGNRLAYTNSDPERYDIIIFEYPDDESDKFIKRVIGLPGDTLTFRDGEVYLNDETEPLDDSFCLEQGVTDQGYLEDSTITVPENCYFVMGDNREDSLDSRYWVHTFVTRDEILAKAVFRYWPFTRFGTIS